MDAIPFHRVKAQRDSVMDRDAYLADDEVRNDETPLAVIVGGRIVDACEVCVFIPRRLRFNSEIPEGGRERIESQGYFYSEFAMSAALYVRVRAP